MERSPRQPVTHSAKSYHQLISRLLRHNATPQLRKVIDKTLPADLSPVLPMLLPQDRDRFINLLIDAGKAGAVLLEVDQTNLTELLGEMSDATLASVCGTSAPDDAADLLDLLDEQRLAAILERLGASRGASLEALLAGEKDTAGSLMTTDFLALDEGMTVGQAIDQLRSYPRKDTFFYAYTVDAENHLNGVLSLRTLILSDPEMTLSEVRLQSVVRASVDASEEEVARLVAKYDLLSIPVVDSQNRLLGVVTVDDIIDVIQEQAEEDLLHLSGVAVSERITSNARSAFRSRFPWLVVNLVMTFITAAVISLFEGTIGQWAILAALMPIVGGLGGNAGMQSLTVFVRALALGDVQWKTGLRAVWKELLVGIMNGLANGLLAAVIVLVWTKDPLLAGLIMIAMTAAMTVASTLGGLIPLILERFDFDPAVSSSIFVSTLTDVAGFFSFLGLATLALRLRG